MLYVIALQAVGIVAAVCVYWRILWHRESVACPYCKGRHAPQYTKRFKCFVLWCPRRGLAPYALGATPEAAKEQWKKFK